MPSAAAPEGKLTAKTRGIFFFVVLILFGIFAVGLKWIFSVSPGNAPFFLFDYAVGLSMIFLPCTLPLAFVIVPLAMGKGYARGLGIAISFGIGVAITLSFYGALIGAFGQALGVSKVELAKNILYTIAGFMAIFFALGEIGLTKFRMPTYSGKIPGFIQRRQEFLKAGLLGLFLGNVGVGCPNPLFNAVIIPQIIATGSVFQGWLIMFVQALGRFTPLLLLAMLGILGVNATAFLVSRRGVVERATGWATVFVGGFMLTLGLFTHDWYVYSGIHTLLEQLTQEETITNILGQRAGLLGHAHTFPSGTGILGQPLSWGSWFMVAIWLIPIFWYWFLKKKDFKALPESEKAMQGSVFKWMTSYLITLSVLLVLVFGYFLPYRFKNMNMMEGMHNDMEMSAVPVIKAFLAATPGPLEVNIPTRLAFNFLDDNDKILTGIQAGHESVMHIFIVKDDFSVFAHLHPEDSEPITQEMLDNAVFAVNYTFPSEGNWRILAQIVHEDHEIVKDFGSFSIGRHSGTNTLTTDLSREKFFGQSEEYRVTISSNPAKIIAGQPVKLDYYIEKDRQPVMDIVPYLGAAMHFAIWSIDQETFSHDHGMLEGETTDEHHGTLLNTVYAHGEVEPAADDNHSETDALPAEFGPDIILNHTFPYAGYWKIFGQFKRGDQVVITDFMVQVFPNPVDMREESTHAH